MLNYNTKEAKALRIQIRKDAEALRAKLADCKYPDLDVRETVSDIIDWARAEGNLNPALRRSYDLQHYVLFNLEDNTQGFTKWYDPNEIEKGMKPTPFSLTEAQVDAALEVDEFCVDCANTMQLGGLNPALAWTLHDGSFCPRRGGREKQGNRRGDAGFNRDLARKESIEDFKNAKRTQRAQDWKEFMANQTIDTVEVSEENVDLINGLLDNLNSRIMDGNFSLDETKGQGGCIWVFHTPHGYRVRPYDRMHTPNSKFEAVAVIFIQKPLVFNDPDKYMYGMSYLDCVHPVSDSYFHTFGQSDHYNRKRKFGAQDILNDTL